MTKIISLYFFWVFMLGSSALAQENSIAVGPPIGLPNAEIAQEIAQALRKMYSANVLVLSSSCETSSCQKQEAQTKGATLVFTINVTNMMGFYGTEIDMFDFRYGGTKVASAEVQGESIDVLTTTIRQKVLELVEPKLQGLQFAEEPTNAETIKDDGMEALFETKNAPASRKSRSKNRTITFAGLLGFGFMYSDAVFESEPPVSGDIASAIDQSKSPFFVPVGLELRMYYTRFMVNLGVESAYSLNGEWEEIYPSNTDSNIPMGCESYECPIEDIETYTVGFNQTNFIGFGYLFGRDAATRLGPRAGFRAGWGSLPNAFTTTAHFGWTVPAPTKIHIHDRIQIIVDADFRIGTLIARSPSFLLLEDESGDVARTALTFGFTLGAGASF